MALIHLDEVIHRLSLDRRRCFVITGRPGQGKTRLARAMAKRYNGRYVDVLADFAADPTRSAELDTFTPKKLKSYLTTFATGSLVLLDEMEFLWCCWDETEKQAVLQQLALWDRSAFLGVFLPADPLIATVSLVDQDRRPRRFAIDELQALE